MHPLTPMPSPGRYVFRIRSYELGPRDQASLSSVCHLLQEAASLHAHELEASPEQLLAQDMTWFLARLRIEIDRYPTWRDAVTVETWPAAVDGPFAIRDFRVFDADGQQIAVASSAWLLMDMAKRKPIRRIPQGILDLHPVEPMRVLPGKPPRLPRPLHSEHEECVRVRRADLDMNGHVNHVFYVAQAEQAVPGELRDGAQVTSFEIEFKSECHEGDEILVASQAMDGAEQAFLHSLVRREDDREVARARTIWSVFG